MKILTGIATAVALAALGGVIWLAATPRDKVAFVYNQQVFENFEGTKALKEKLEHHQQEARAMLDSLSVLIQAGRKDLQPRYEEKARELSLKHKELTDRYTADIWVRINEEIAAFAKEKGYDFVLGAAGNGSLMYAGENKNVTDEFVAYLNKNYSGSGH
jgi:outer membrane protein